MSKPTSADLHRRAQRSFPAGLAPVCCLCGEEEFFTDQLVDRLIETVPEDQRSFNLDILFGAECGVERVVTASRSFPMMGERRVVVVREFQNLRTGGSDGGFDLLENYLANPSPSTLLCLADARPIDRRTALGKMMAGLGERFFEFKRLPDYRIPDWAIEWTQSHHGKRLESDAAARMADLAGSDLNILSAELDKLSSFVDNRDVITREDVEEVTGGYRESTVLELSDSILKRDLQRSLAVAEQLLLRSDTGTGEVLMTVGLLTSSFTKIWRIQRLSLKGVPDAHIRQEVGIRNDYQFSQLRKQANRFSLQEMPMIFEALLDADMAAKGFGGMPASHILPLLIRRILWT